ncbi:MAG TPA: DUF5320 domain-containing protein [Victivallales bacterium]|nr:DUF5320 domain-containing protein [Victivallales bacterium]
MPRGDGTGPIGMGPKTGRSAGFCAGFESQGFMNPGLGFGGRMGRGFFCRGGGRGMRNMFYATGLPGWMRGGWAYPAAAPYPQQASNAEDEKSYLENYAKGIEGELEEVKRRIKELEKETK